MMKDITFCSALFCDLSHNCKRQEHLGKPYDEQLSFADFSKDGVLHFNDVQELVCDAQLTK